MVAAQSSRADPSRIFPDESRLEQMAAAPRYEYTTDQHKSFKPCPIGRTERGGFGPGGKHTITTNWHNSRDTEAARALQ